MKFLTRDRLLHLLDAIPALRVGVLGDFTLDGYWTADMTRARLSRETPLFPRPVSEERYSPGGAANVAWNAAALGARRVEAFTLLGRDWRTPLLRELLEQAGVSLDNALEAEGWKTPFFGKVILQGYQASQEDARLDMLNTQPPPAEYEARLSAALACGLPELDALIAADYHPAGVVTPRLTQTLLEQARRFPRVVCCVDSRERAAEFSPLYLKPNQLEAAGFLFPGRNPASVPPEELAQAAQQFAARQGAPLFITLGSRGCWLVRPEGVTLLAALPVPPPVDPVGAGDTFLSGLTCALAAGAALEEAGEFANLCAAVTIRKLGVTGTAAPGELLELFDAQRGEQ